MVLLVAMCSVFVDDKKTQDWIREEYDHCIPCMKLRLDTATTIGVGTEVNNIGIPRLGNV